MAFQGELQQVIETSYTQLMHLSQEHNKEWAMWQDQVL